MRLVSKHAEYAVWLIMDIIRRDSGSWEGWQYLRINTPGLEVHNKRFRIRSDICSFLESSLQEREGTVFLYNFDEVVFFCRGIPEPDLKSIGSQILDMLAEKAELTGNLEIFDVCKDSESLLNLYNYGGLANIGEYETPPSADTQKTQPPITGQKVLLVEDDAVTRLMVSHALKNECRLEMAENVNSAISLYRSYKPNSVLLDLNLSGENGRDVMAAIMQSDPNAYILILSISNSIENIVGLLERGAKGFIAKPFRKEKLLQYIRNAPVLKKMSREYGVSENRSQIVTGSVRRYVSSQFATSKKRLKERKG